MRGRLWLWWTIAGVLATAAYFLLPTGSLAAGVYYDALGIVATVVMFVAARGRLVWRLFAVGTALWVGGDIVYSYYQLVLHREPFPSPADAFYLAAYPVLAGAALKLLRSQSGAPSRAAVIDASIVATGVGLVLWTFVMQPIARDGTVDVLTRVISLSYSAGDMLLLAMVARLLVSGARDGSVRLLTGALIALFVADAAYSVVTSYTGYEGGIFDAGWLLSYVLWSAAALYPPARRARRAGGDGQLGFGRLRLVLLACCSLLAPAVLLVQGLTQPHDVDWLPVGLCAVVLFLLVVIRMAGLVGQVRTLAMRDALTGLANRRELELRIRRNLAGGGQVVLIDLDDFKAINDRLGHNVGDRLLVAVAARLRGVVRPGDTVARLGGDEFAVLLPGTDNAEADALVAAMSAALAVPVHAGPHRLLIRASIGVADCADTDDPFEPLRRADIAMYAAKETGGRHLRYDMVLDERAIQHAELGADLRTALDDRQFRVVYQPIVALPSGDMIAVEALVRWLHPARGPISPVDFIPVAEHNGLIVELGAWVLREACARMVRWRETRGADAPQRVSVNVSARQLSEPDFADTVAEILAATGLPPGCLVVEVTETAVFDSDRALATLRAVKALGVRIALDDFGTGHSSLNLLQTAPVDILKVDKSFVDDITRPGRQSVIATALIDVSNHLQIIAIAEGVETAEQAEELYRLGYRFVQGYHFGKPVPDLVPSGRHEARHAERAVVSPTNS